MTGNDLARQAATKELLALGEKLHLCKAFDAAIENLIAEQAQALLESGADMYGKDGEKGRTFLHFAAMSNYAKLCALVLEKGMDSGVRDYQDDTPLHLAAKKGGMAACEYLIQKGADVNARNNSNWSALHEAAVSGNKEICNILIENGADVNARDSGSITPIILAAFELQYHTCKLLMEKKADVNIVRSDGLSPLHAATLCEGTNLCRLFIENGAEVNARDNIGSTPLHLAVNTKNAATVNVLLAAGANPAIRDEFGDCPEDNEWFQHYMDGLAIESKAFSQSLHGAVRAHYFEPDGALNPKVMDICITDQFHQLVALPLITSKDSESLALCKDIFDALPDPMKVINNQTAALLTKREGGRGDKFLMGGEPELHAAQEEARRKSAARGQERGA